MKLRTLALWMICLVTLTVARGARADTCFASNPSSGYACWLWTTNAFTGSATQWRNNAGDLELNYVYVPPNPDTSRGGHRTLLVFLAGTGSSAGAYKNFMAEATLRGYYVIGLTYRNQVHSPDLCGYWPNCAGNLYQQNVMGEFNGFYGADAAAGLSAGANSINYRLGMFLTWLNQNHIGNINWGEFWDNSAAYTTGEGFAYNGQPFWSRIVIAGHSQGGETATWITKNKPVIAGLVFNAPYANLNNDHSGDDANDTTPNGPPHHMKRVNGVWTDVTWDVTHWATTGGTASDTTFANVLDPSTWPAGRIDRLFITLDAYDPGYDLGQAHGKSWPGHYMRGAGLHLGKTETHLNACPAQLATRFNTFDDNSSTCGGHSVTVVDGCTPSWVRCYWDLMLDRALTL